MTDRYLLEAMREVDEMTPACPPIAPPRDSLMERYLSVAPSACIEVDLQIREIANQLAPLRHYELMQNAANRNMTPEELDRYNRGMQNAATPTDSEDKT